MALLARLNDGMLPFAALLGVRFVAAEPDRVAAELLGRGELCTRPAVLHGGALMAFADTLGAAGTVLNLPEGARTTTVESKTNLRPRRWARASLARRCRYTEGAEVWPTRLARENGRLVAVVIQIQLVLPATSGTPRVSGTAGVMSPLAARGQDGRLARRPAGGAGTSAGACVPVGHGGPAAARTRRHGAWLHGRPTEPGRRREGAPPCWG